MNALTAFKVLGPIDLKSIQRDALLRWIGIIPLIFALAIRGALPLLVQRLGQLFAVDIMPYYVPMMGYFLLTLTPILVGTVIGFLLLDQRDDGTLIALSVTPLSLSNYLIYRLAAPMVVSIIATLLAFPIAGVAGMSAPMLLLATFLASWQAPLFALFLPIFAANKVQGFALMKASGLVMWPPLMAYFAPPAWQWLFGIVPTYWPAMLFWQLQTGEGSIALYFGVGLLYQLALLIGLARRFQQVMTQ